MLIFCDSAILIYLLDASGSFHDRALRHTAALNAAGDEFVVSDLVRLECLVRPFRDKDAAVVALFDAFFSSPGVQQAPLGRAVFDRAAQIRAEHRFKTVDALHLAAAIEFGCFRFLTNDKRLSAFPDIAIEILP